MKALIQRARNVDLNSRRAYTHLKGNLLNVLVIEDERKLAEAVAEGLGGEGFTVTLAMSGEEALERLRDHNFDLLLLDVMLPKRSGLEVLADLRHAGLRVPVLMITSRDAIEDRVRGLDAGADDYLVKPFAFAELVARVRALLRRNMPVAASVLHIADLTLEVKSRTAMRGEVRLDLTHREFDILEYLMLNRDSVVSREMLARNVWKQTVRYSPLNNVINVQMARLRNKVDDNRERKLLHTVRGVGFVIREEEA